MIEDGQSVSTWRTHGERDLLWDWILKQGIFLAAHFEARFRDDPGSCSVNWWRFELPLALNTLNGQCLQGC